jgi:hypothetical protein
MSKASQGIATDTVTDETASQRGAPQDRRRNLRPRRVAHARVIPSWPLLLLAAPATVAVWSGWVGLGKLTGFGIVHPFPGLWDQFRVNTAITLPVGVEAYGAYALRAWLAADRVMSERTRQYARWSALGSLLLGVSGQVAYHLLSQSRVTSAPWGVTMAVASLPVLVLGMGAALAHMIRADGDVSQEGQHDRVMPGEAATSLPAVPGAEAAQLPADPNLTLPGAGGPLAEDEDEKCEESDRLEIARVTALQLTSTGVRVSRRTLRDAGLRGSNAELSALVRAITADLAESGQAPSRRG